jgi:hypothetical protein
MTSFAFVVVKGAEDVVAVVGVANPRLDVASTGLVVAVPE